MTIQIIVWSTSVRFNAWIRLFEARARGDVLVWQVLPCLPPLTRNWENSMLKWWRIIEQWDVWVWFKCGCRVLESCYVLPLGLLAWLWRCFRYRHYCACVANSDAISWCRYSIAYRVTVTVTVTVTLQPWEKTSHQHRHHCFIVVEGPSHRSASPTARRIGYGGSNDCWRVRACLVAVTFVERSRSYCIHYRTIVV